MATIARIVVSDSDLQNRRQLFVDFVAESKQHLSKGEKHQFVLLPAGFLLFAANDDLEHIPITEPQEEAEKQKWNARIKDLKKQALAEFHRSFDSGILKELKSIANHLVIGINSQDRRIQFVLVYDLQSAKAIHWTGKSYPNTPEKDFLIQMPIDSHFMKQKIDGKKVAVFGCHDLSIFNPRHQKHFSPFEDERKGAKRKDNTATGKIKCPFIDATLDFGPDIMLQLPHSEGTWAAKWTTLNKWLRRKTGKELQHFATGIKRSPKRHYPLSGTQGEDVINFVNGKLVTK